MDDLILVKRADLVKLVDTKTLTGYTIDEHNMRSGPGQELHRRMDVARRMLSTAKPVRLNTVGQNELALKSAEFDPGNGLTNYTAFNYGTARAFGMRAPEMIDEVKFTSKLILGPGDKVHVTIQIIEDEIEEGEQGEQG